MNWRGVTLLVTIAALLCLTFTIPRIAQDEAYHHFADQRTLLGVPNCLKVISNSLFLMVGVLGLTRLSQPRQKIFVDLRERWPWLTFFASVTLTAFGSVYYHLNPNDNTLVWDRLPMAVGFMALVAAVVAERINIALGLWLLAPLSMAGAASVIYWKVAQAHGHGDLRPYALAQFGSLPILLLLLALYPARYTHATDLIASLAIYGIAKGFEGADKAVFNLGHVVSGHTLKHIAAALSTYWILRMLRRRLMLLGCEPTTA